MEKVNVYARLVFIACLGLASPLYSQSCPPGLISYWKMDETSGLTLFDRTGGHDALCNMAPVNVPDGKIGSAYFFVADSNSGVTSTVSNNADFNFPAHSSFTLLYWIKITAGDLEGREHAIISRGNFRNGHPSGAFWSSGIGSDGKLNFLLQDSDLNHSEIETSLDYADGKWHQVACVRDENSKTNTIFVDGIESAQSDKNYSGSFSMTDSVQFCQLKNSVNDSASFGFFFQGTLDEVAIFNTALTSGDLSDQILLANLDIGLCDGLSAHIVSVPGVKARVGSPYSYQLHAAGLQKGMTYSLLSGPEGMGIDSLGGLLSWTPRDSKTQALVSVRASNQIPPADTQTFRIYLTEGTPCPDSLMVLLKLDEKTGPVYSDFYGMHNAEATVSPMAAEGKIGGAQLFNDSTAMEIPDNGMEFDWSKDASFTYEYWMKTSSPTIMIVMARHRLDSQHTAYMATGTDSTGKARFELRDNKGVIVILNGTTMLADGNWHYIVNVRNGKTNENIIYVDGVPENIYTVSYDSSFIAVVPTPISVGHLIREFSYEATYHFLGSLDEIAIYNRAVTAEEVLDFYNNGVPENHCGEGNFAPVITSRPDTGASVQKEYSYTLMADDIDTADVLTLSAVDLPEWLTFNWQAGQKTASLDGTPDTAGHYPVTLRVSDGKIDVDQNFTIAAGGSVPTLSNDLESDGILVYPVPARDQLILFFKEPGSVTQLEIINSEGKVMHQAVLDSADEKHIIGLRDMPDGNYFLHIQKDNTSKTIPFVIAR
jgi:hypothetical protein